MIRSIALRIPTLALLASAIVSTAQAGDLAGSVSLTSAYISRGTDQNVLNGAALQGFVTYSHGPFYVSAFASSMNYGEGTTKELDFFGGVRKSAGPWTVDLGFANINYPDNHTPLNFVEYDLKVDRAIGKGNVGVWLGYTDAYFNTYGQGVWTEAHASYPITQSVSISGAVANQDLPNNFDYRTWNIGLTKAFAGGVSADLRYSDTDRHDLDPRWNTYGARTSLTLTKSF
ncbi:hypothetical protein HOU03_gp342 [Caulobacter phage CcrSC]|uniref:Uncharacterized protein n=1 Tax=Caulobacter phage CcrSC TaxID=2283272 RepID=A0A385EE24_9CAUD|nr:hypothetical protein HOU03_gp342 [Caulobacter phage CcrSC]AXQ69926.1 hypothetical protein CcrSC_gp344 [Caulobacter phage CcrSC]